MGHRCYSVIITITITTIIKIIIMIMIMIMIIMVVIIIAYSYLNNLATIINKIYGKYQLLIYKQIHKQHKNII
jgi:hypothetical protein